MLINTLFNFDYTLKCVYVLKKRIPQLGGDDKIIILELDFLHLHEGEGHKMMRFGESQSSLA